MKNTEIVLLSLDFGIKGNTGQIIDFARAIQAATPTVAGQDATVRDAALEEAAIIADKWGAGRQAGIEIRAMKAKP